MFSVCIVSKWLKLICFWCYLTFVFRISFHKVIKGNTTVHIVTYPFMDYHLFFWIRITNTWLWHRNIEHALLCVQSFLNSFSSIHPLDRTLLKPIQNLSFLYLPSLFHLRWNEINDDKRANSTGLIMILTLSSRNCAHVSGASRLDWDTNPEERHPI